MYFYFFKVNCKIFLIKHRAKGGFLLCMIRKKQLKRQKKKEKHQAKQNRKHPGRVMPKEEAVTDKG